MSTVFVGVKQLRPRRAEWVCRRSHISHTLGTCWPHMQSRNVLSKKAMTKKKDAHGASEEPLDNINLFGIIQIMSLIILLPVSLYLEGWGLTPAALTAMVGARTRTWDWVRAWAHEEYGKRRHAAEGVSGCGCTHECVRRSWCGRSSTGRTHLIAAGVSVSDTHPATSLPAGCR